MPNKHEAALELLDAFTRLGIEVSMKVILRPSDRVTPQIQAQARTLAEELRELVAERYASKSVKQNGNGAMNSHALNEDGYQCWRCGAGETPPSLADQVEELERAHRSRGTPWDWPHQDFVRLLQLLRPGDVLAIARNVWQMSDPLYGSVSVCRNGSWISIDHRLLMES
jgi:hypothetical protein